MRYSQATRKLVLLVHMLSSAGWIGAVAAFLASALAGLRSSDPQTVRAAYLVMEPITWWVIIPLAFASLVTGLFLSLGTRWGFLRHYWVVFKLLINLLSIPVLLLHTSIIHRVGATAKVRNLQSGELIQDRTQLVIAAIAALVVLVCATILSVYKPKGLLYPDQGGVRQLNAQKKV